MRNTFMLIIAVVLISTMALAEGVQLQATKNKWLIIVSGLTYEEIWAKALEAVHEPFGMLIGMNRVSGNKLKGQSVNEFITHLRHVPQGAALKALGGLAPGNTPGI